MNTLCFLLACYGLCFGLINKAVFLRRSAFLNRMLDCSYCTGFHAGWLIHIMMVGLAGALTPSTLCSAFSSAAFCYIIDVAVIFLEERTAQVKADSNTNHHPNLFG